MTQDYGNSSEGYPGTRQHQALLHAVVSYYANDPRILSVGVFGSLGRGTWDNYSDLDLDVVVADDAIIDVMDEIARLCDSFTSIGERLALVVPDGDDAGDAVLESLMQLSIRYHSLETTSPDIVDSLRMLTGRIDRAAIIAAGWSNRRSVTEAPGTLLDRCVRYAVETDVALQRKRVWSALDSLERMRVLVMKLFADTHHGTRALHSFQAQADPKLQSRLGGTLPAYNLTSAQESLLLFLDFLERDLTELADGQVQLNNPQRQLLNHIRQRQTHLNVGGEDES